MQVKDFRIFGVHLNDNQAKVDKVLSARPTSCTRHSETLETWAWDVDSRVAPRRIHWVKQRVSQISGCQLSVLGYDFDHSSALGEVRNLVPESEFLEISKPGLLLLRPDFTLSVRISPNGNLYTLCYSKLESQRNEIMCELSEKRKPEDYQQFTISVDKDQD